jgi:hypothetical protein
VKKMRTAVQVWNTDLNWVHSFRLGRPIGL